MTKEARGRTAVGALVLGVAVAVAGIVAACSGSTAGEPDPEVMKRMQYYNEALGVGCDYCHIPGKFTIETPRMKTSRWMQESIVDAVVTRDGHRSIDCKSCHAGKAKFLPTSEGY